MGGSTDYPQYIPQQDYLGPVTDIKFSHQKKNSGKSHVLLCEKHVTCGSCPYEAKCKYVHDRDIASHCRFVNKPVKSEKDRSKSVEVRDSFFWPNSQGETAGDRNEYTLLPDCEPKFYLRHRAVYSMWNHFRMFCADSNARAKGVSLPYENDPANDWTNAMNTFTSTRRLDVFRTLSSGQSVCPEVEVSSEPVPLSTESPAVSNSEMPKDTTGAESPTSVTRVLQPPSPDGNVMKSLPSSKIPTGFSNAERFHLSIDLKAAVNPNLIAYTSPKLIQRIN